MNKQKIVPIAVLTLLALGTATAGLSKLSPTVVHAQSPSAQVQQSVASQSTDKEAPGTQEKAESVEPANEAAQEKNLPGGGHRDIGETVDHQFEGVE